MVWQFEKFEGFPVVHDYSNKGESLSIYFFPKCPEDTKNIFDNPDFYKNFVEFSMGAESLNSTSDLILRDKKLIRKMWSIVNDPRTPNVTEATWKNIGYASYEDMLSFARNFIDRFPYLKNEITLPTSSVVETLPKYARETREWYKEEVGRIDWQDFTKVINRKFYEMFTGAIESRMASHQQPLLTPKNARELSTLVNMLT